MKTRNEKLARLLKAAKKLPPMTTEQLEAQRINFAYGNAKLSGLNVTKEDIIAAAKRMSP